MNHYKKQAFTLVELIVVITILAILWTIAFIALQWYSAQARDSKRVSDIWNIKKSLELFSINTWKYPLPDNEQIVSYSWETLWNQWTVWDNITTNLSRNLNKKPIDPLTELEYTYSVINTQTQYELLSIYESDLVSYNNLTNQTNAVNLSYPKIDWNYNWVFVKSTSYYVPTPSIINSEVDGVELILDDTNITSQIITGWDNILANWEIEVQIDWLPDFTLEVFSWTLDTDLWEDDNGAKEDLALALIDAYSWSLLASEWIYKEIVETSWTDNLIALVDDIVLNPTTYASTSWWETTPINWICWIDNWWDFSSTPTNLCDSWTESIVTDNWEWSTYDWTCIWIDWWTTDNCSANHLAASYPWCDTWDITFWSYTIAWCNVWATTWTEYALCVDSATCTTARVWNYYQFGKSDSSWINWDPWYSYDWKSPGWTDAWSANDWWVEDSEKTTATYSNQNTTDQAKMQWPCADWYHVPTDAEWVWIHAAGWWWTNWANMLNDLKMPLSGDRSPLGPTYNQGNVGHYWASSPYGNDGYNMNFGSNIYPSSARYRSAGFSVRCFKN